MSNLIQLSRQTGINTPLSAYRTQQYAMIEKFVKHRECCYNRVSPKKLEIMTAISQLKRALDFYRYSSPADFCHVILRLQSQLKLLIPGEHSRYHAGAVKTVNSVISFAKSYLQID